MLSQDDSTQLYGEAVRQHYKSIYNFLAYLSGDKAVAEDLTQETFLAALLGISTCKNQASLKNWLYKIAYHKFIDFKRRSVREADLYGDCEQNVCVFLNSPEPITKLINDESIANVYEAMIKLDLADYSVIILHYIEGVSFSDMARILDEPAGTVKARDEQSSSKVKNDVVRKGINMSANRKDESKDRTLSSIERTLRSLPKMEPSESLEAKLMAMSQTHAIPMNKSFLALHIRLTRFAASTAAAIFILLFMLMIGYGLSTGPNVSFAQFDTSLYYPAYDVNHLLYSRDTNDGDRFLPVNVIRKVSPINDFNR